MAATAITYADDFGDTITEHPPFTSGGRLVVVEHNPTGFRLTPPLAAGAAAGSPPRSTWSATASTARHRPTRAPGTGIATCATSTTTGGPPMPDETTASPPPAKRRGGRPRKPAEHGTVRRYRQHLADGETACDPCNDANNEAAREYAASRGARTGKIGRPRTAECGTRSGYNRHLLDGTDPCDPCNDANNEHVEDFRAARRAAAD